MSVPTAPPEGVTRPIPRALLGLAVPALLSFLLRIAYQWVDALWVRRLGVEATAAVTTSVFVMWGVLALNDVFGVGVAAFTSQLLGAGQRRRAGLAAWKGLRASALTGLIGTAAGVFAARRVYALLDPSPHMAGVGASYLGVVLAAAPLPMVALTCESIMRAAGDTRTPLLLDLCAVALNALLAPFLIYGWGPLPALGVAGSAWATVIAQALLVACYLALALRGHRAFPLARHAEGPPVRLRGMVRVGVPAALIGLLFSVVYVAFAHSASRFGPAALAIVGVANRVEALQFAFAAAIGVAGSALVGQNLGAGRPDRAGEVIRVGLTWSVWIGAAITALMLACPAFLIGLFTRDPGVLALGVPYVRVLALCMIPTAVEISTAESIQGSGHTVVLSWIYSIISLVRIPLAFLAPGWGASGVLGIAWVITVTCVARAAAILAWAARGTWKSGLAHELHGPGARPSAE